MTTKLTITADFGGTTGQKTGVFELGENGPRGDEGGGASIEDTIRTGFLLENAGQSVLNAYKQAVDDAAPFRRGIHVDFGGGQHVLEVDFATPQNQTKDDGSMFQWGSSGDPDVGPNEHTATGGSPQQQMAVLINYLRQGRIDSSTPATFETGPYSSDGILEPLDVVVESPNMTITNDSVGWADGTLTLVETVDIEAVVDKTLRRD